jgi:cytochrome c-type biogenesis protein CcsB
MQWVIVACFGGYVGFQLIRAAVGDPANGFHLREFASIPVIEGGRIKPLDTYMRGRLMLINQRQTFQDSEDKTQSAAQWFLDTMTIRHDLQNKNRAAMQYKIFRIENLDVLALLQLEPRPGKWRYSMAEFVDHIEQLDQESKRARKVDGRQRTLYDGKLLELADHVGLFVAIATLQSPGFVPTKTDWISLAEALQNARGPGGTVDPKRVDPVAMDVFSMIESFKRGDVDRFNATVKAYNEDFEKAMPSVMSTARMEVYFNELAPFYHCAILYCFVFVLACVSWLGWFATLNRAAFWSMVLVALLHTWALLIRIYIQGRPPVTNLYSSAIFIGWGCAVTCLFVEYFYRNSIALAVGSITGALSLQVAHMLSLDSADTMEMMEAVLDTNFWLATHVTCITLGYNATFVAGFMGITYVLAMASSAVFGMLGGHSARVRSFLESPESRQGVRGFFTRFFDTDASSVMGNMIYGIVCFGMFLSFTGTVLGGLWADYSWGRFWGWDPKENGALLIVIWCALILHARWAGMVKQRGVAVLAVLGNIVTAWSWFGTNFLGVGLHSYGFRAGAMNYLLMFDAAILTIAVIGLLPLRQWAKLPPNGAVATPAHV